MVLGEEYGVLGEDGEILGEDGGVTNARSIFINQANVYFFSWRLNRYEENNVLFLLVIKSL